jgi:hypothetical protein
MMLWKTNAGKQIITKLFATNARIKTRTKTAKTLSRKEQPQRKMNPIFTIDI